MNRVCVCVFVCVCVCVYRNQALNTAIGQMDDEWNYTKLDSYKPALSLLFNSFILAQVHIHPHTHLHTHTNTFGTLHA